MIFKNNPLEIKKKRKKITEMRRLFKERCRNYLSAQHEEDVRLKLTPKFPRNNFKSGKL